MTFKREFFRFEKPIAANYDTPSGVSCFQLYIPDALDHLYILQGLMAALTKEDFWDGTASWKAQMAYMWQAGYDATDWSNCVNPSQVGLQDFIVLNQVFTEVVSGGALLFTKTINNGGIVSQTGNAINDHWKISDFRLRPGTYQHKMQVQMSTLAGMLHLWIEPDGGGTDIDLYNTIDLYASPALENAIYTTTFTIATDGLYELHGQVPAKRAAAVGYGSFLTGHQITRTGP